MVAREVAAPMFADDAMMARIVLGGRAADWKSSLAMWKKRGFPLPDPSTGLWYVKAVEAWFDKEYGLDKNTILEPDGKEDFDAWRAKKRKVG